MSLFSLYFFDSIIKISLLPNNSSLRDEIIKFLEIKEDSLFSIFSGISLIPAELMILSILPIIEKLLEDLISTISLVTILSLAK